MSGKGNPVNPSLRLTSLYAQAAPEKYPVSGNSSVYIELDIQLHTEATRKPPEATSHKIRKSCIGQDEQGTESHAGTN